VLKMMSFPRTLTTALFVQLLLLVSNEVVEIEVYALGLAKRKGLAMGGTI